MIVDQKFFASDLVLARLDVALELADSEIKRARVIENAIFKLASRLLREDQLAEAIDIFEPANDNLVRLTTCDSDDDNRAIA
jgi:hypothetical protein